ncbi:hypothetical protein Msi02_71410 [Microbispora siamensis]|uniref:HPF/RaiA family ribosome-associated protein n=2 Tax=Microbispora siamensis TaxID=564413 RepID=A0ABQ4GY05_9ACTN|nr:hypothetical protein Msi02_71410 [Microbispora siamensis]
MESHVTESKKGSIDQLVVELPAVAAISGALARILRLWLQRDRDREISAEIRLPHSDPVIVKASGEGVSLDALQKAIDTAVTQLQKPKDE